MRDQRGMSSSVQSVVLLPVAIGLLLLLIQWSLVSWAQATALAAAQEAAAAAAPLGASLHEAEALGATVTDNGSLTGARVTVERRGTQIRATATGQAVRVLWPRQVSSTVVITAERLTGS